MATFRYFVQSTAAREQTFAVDGSVTVPAIVDWNLLMRNVLRLSFEALTEGRAIYGKPGEGCQGPFTITKIVLERTDG